MSDNVYLNKICSEKEFTIKSLEADRASLSLKNEELTMKLNQLTSQLNAKENSLNYNSHKLNDVEKNVIKLQVLKLKLKYFHYINT